MSISAIAPQRIACHLVRDLGIYPDLWRVKAATSAKSLGLVITSPVVIEQIRKELRRQTSHNMDAGELCDLLKSSVLRSEAL